MSGKLRDGIKVTSTAKELLRGLFSHAGGKIGKRA